MLQEVNRTGAPAPGGGVPSMTLGAYLAEAGKALRTGIPRAWVGAIVLEARTTNVGMSLELVEPSSDEVQDGRPADKRDGRLRSTIWSKTGAAIESSHGLKLDPALLKGAFVRVLIETCFHPRWHLEGKVLDLDPAVVEGLVQRRLELIRQQLRDQGHWARQQSLAAPRDVTSVAVIHPDRSAGWADVQAELDRLQQCGILAVCSYPVPFEGAGAAHGITDALKAIAIGALPDLVMIVRGGGAASSLVGLANFAMARAVCLCPVPVVTGIGHASDRTILDDCAWRSADTPSKGLGVVKTILRQRYHAARDAHHDILDAMAFRVGGTLQPLLANARETLVDAVEAITAGQAARLRDLAHGIERHLIAFRGTIDLTQADLDRVAADLVVSAPAAPRRGAKELTNLRAGMVRIASLRLPDRNALSVQAKHSAGLAAAFVDRQSRELRTAFAAMESTMRRRLGEETSRLAVAGKAAQALDLDATLARGFVLPLDHERRIIRSAAATEIAAGFELLFVDGQVKVQADPRPTMP